uniref:C2H2-type domain-containing protein n=1 Tax=Trichuris muris TaxID=70415 RepID=A0A5S6QVF5_TRIMR
MTALSSIAVQALKYSTWKRHEVEVKTLTKTFQTTLWSKKSNRPAKSAGQSCEKAVPCPLHACRKTFINERVAQRHVQVHRSRVHVCITCGKAFSNASKLKRHHLVHSREKQFQCEVPGCSKRFTLSFNLKRHMKTHTGQTKPYGCTFPQCGQSFATLSALNNHVLRKHPENI